MTERGIKILDLPMEDNDADAKTIREYLILLLLGVWKETEGFDGKRPFGNSGWWCELYNTLAKNKMIKSETDSWGDVEYDDDDEAEMLIVEAIKSL